MYAILGKRLLDLTASAFALVVLSPVLLVLILAVRIVLGRPVLFVQQRPGSGGRPFALPKFRTMTDAHNAEGLMRLDAERLTRFGRLLRASSLDELPELICVLKGDMSLVGPRPLLPQYLARYSPEQARRHEVKPGITGWAQVNGRNAISWDQKFELDVWYVDHVSFWLDIKILCMTVWQVIMRRGVNAPGEATMPEFMGSGPCA